VTPPPDDLRARLLSEARALLDEGGIDAVGIREVARRAEVSHGAPRRHFASRQVLLAELAAEGFAELGAGIDDAVGGVADPQAALVAAGCAYVAFARAQPARFDLMFRHDLLEGSGISLRERWRPLRERQAALVAAAGGDDPLSLWVAVHGVAAISARRGFDILAPRPDERALVVGYVRRHLA
jgi:AcrR family transcriptional regulator